MKRSGRTHGCNAMKARENTSDSRSGQTSRSSTAFSTNGQISTAIQKLPSSLWGIETRNLNQKRDVVFKDLSRLLEKQPYYAAVKSTIPKTNRLLAVCQSLQRQREAESFAADTRPVIHERVLKLIKQYLDLHRSAEVLMTRRNIDEVTAKRLATFYSSLSFVDFLDRLLCKRPLVFFNPQDAHLLRNGRNAAGSFDMIGTNQECIKSIYNIKEYMSYDDMAVAALLAMSTPTFFINHGDRGNCARPASGNSAPFNPSGIYIGQVRHLIEMNL